MAKGQKKSNREAKKPKKTEAERLKAKSALIDLQILSPRDKGASKKS
jgi:hypothetical protein